MLSNHVQYPLLEWKATYPHTLPNPPSLPFLPPFLPPSRSNQGQSNQPSLPLL